MLLELTNVESLQRRHPRLKGVNLSVDAGKIVALLGANGAGRPDPEGDIGAAGIRGSKVTGGSIQFRGCRPLRGAADLVRRGLVQVIEGRRILPHMTVEQNLLVGGKVLAGAPTPQMLQKVYGYFPKLVNLRTRVSGYLSGGEQQMLVIGRALMAKPRLILLDEPSLGLGAVIVTEIFELVERLRQQEGIAFLVVEQNANVALASRRPRLRDGKRRRISTVPGTGPRAA